MLNSFSHAFFYSRNILTWYGTTKNLINKLETASRWQRFNLHNYIAILAMATALFLVLAFYLSGTTNGFLVFNNRSFQVCFYAEFSLHSFHDDFQMLIAHTTDQGFLGYRISGNNESRIFISQTI